MQNLTVFNKNAGDHMTANMFLDPNGGPDIARFDQVKYPEIEHSIEKQLGFFWRPQEVVLDGDRGQFALLKPHEQFIFTSNLKRQIILDSVQGRSPVSVLGPVTTLPEMETWNVTWSFMEQIHSRSYTHIIREVYTQAGTVFDEMRTIPEIMECAEDISRYYNDFYQYSTLYQLLGYGTHTINGETIVIEEYELKKKLWLTLMSINILEGIRFYVSFACSWAFAENRLMEGNAKIIRLICRDENLHLGVTQRLLRTILPNDDPMFARVKKDTVDECTTMFMSAIRQEKLWAKFLFKDGTIIGLNEALLCKYVDYIAGHRMRAVNLTIPYEIPARNPLPWTDNWISSKALKVAPQETENSQYITGGVKQDVKKESFKGFGL